MKKILAIIFACIMAISMVACSKNNDKEIIDNTSTIVTEKTDNVEKNETTETEKETEKIFERVATTEKREDNPNGSYTIYVYDANDVIMKSTKYSEKDEIESVSEHDENGFIINTRKTHLSLGQILTEYENDKDGKVLKATMYKDEKGGMVLVDTTIYEYYESGNIKLMTTYDTNNNKIHVIEYYDTTDVATANQYRYDTSGEILEEYHFDENGKEIILEK